MTNCAVKEVKADGVTVEIKCKHVEELPSAMTIWCVAPQVALNVSKAAQGDRNQAATGD